MEKTTMDIENKTLSYNIPETDVSSKSNMYSMRDIKKKLVK